MYLPAHFEEGRAEELHRLIREHPLGAMVTSGPNGLDANHIPFDLDTTANTPHGVLRAHVARANPVWQDTPDGSEVLVIFRGPEQYISPNWYPSKHELHRQVPTWNYMVVHAHGRIAIRDDTRFVRGVIARLTRTHEANEPKPWKMSDSAREHIDAMVQAVVGLEIELTRLTGKFKLSQNREDRDRQGAADTLRNRGNEPFADAMLAAPPAVIKS